MNGATETKETAVENRTSDEFIAAWLLCYHEGATPPEGNWVDVLLDLQDLRALLSPAGTKRERQERLVEIAKRLGFRRIP